MAEHPIQLVVSDDLERSRLTVFFRILLAIPHLIWLVLWGIFSAILALINWFATLIRGTSPREIHDLLAQYLRYMTHVHAYLLLVANPYPGFLGVAGSYPVDLIVAPPQRQNRWKTGFRIILAIPAILLGAALLGSGGARSSGFSYSSGIAATIAFLGWWAALFTARMPRGFRDVQVWALSFSAQLDGYLFLLTDRYPDSDPAAAVRGSEMPPHPVVLAPVQDDLRRSRLTVFFRVLLAIPHIILLYLWGIVALLAAVANWFATLFSGTPPRALHRFISSYVRYAIQVYSYLFLVANPFPPFSAKPGTYPVAVEIGPPERQNRWRTGFRIVLAVPAILVTGGYFSLLYLASLLGWWAALFTARMPRGLRNVGLVALRYDAQLLSYLYLLTDRYPYSGPTDPALAVAGEPPELAAPSAAAVPAPTPEPSLRPEPPPTPEQQPPA